MMINRIENVVTLPGVDTKPRGDDIYGASEGHKSASSAAQGGCFVEIG
jgi:hypothetical protein